MKTRKLGTTKVHRLEENIGAVNVELSKDDLTKIEKNLAKINIVGGRYPAGSEKMVDNN